MVMMVLMMMMMLMPKINHKSTDKRSTDDSSTFIIYIHSHDFIMSGFSIFFPRFCLRCQGTLPNYPDGWTFSIGAMGS